MAAAPWKQLLLSAMDSNANLKHSTYFQLATIGSNGRPSNRTVVFRGFVENGDKIQINTDSRSSKIEEIKRCPFGEICWYFTESWEQFRINGKIEFIDKDNSDAIKLQMSFLPRANFLGFVLLFVKQGEKNLTISDQQREKAWFSSSLKSRLQYLVPAPRLPCSQEPGADNQLNPSTGPTDAFCILVLDPEQVDYLNLKSNERLIFTCGTSNGDKDWTLEKVNP